MSSERVLLLRKPIASDNACILSTMSDNCDAFNIVQLVSSSQHSTGVLLNNANKHCDLGSHARSLPKLAPLAQNHWRHLVLASLQIEMRVVGAYALVLARRAIRFTRFMSSRTMQEQALCELEAMREAHRVAFLLL